MVKQFQKPKGNGGRQRKFVFCGKNYCFVSWFRENKPFRARIHFGTTHSIGTYSDLEQCLLAIAEFTRERVESTDGKEQLGWRQRDEKALSQLQGYVKNNRKELKEIKQHFEKKKEKKGVKLSAPVRRVSPIIPPMSLKLEQMDYVEPMQLDFADPVKLEHEQYVQPIKLERVEVEPIILQQDFEDEDYSFLFNKFQKNDGFYYNPHENFAMISPAISPPVMSPRLSTDILEPPVLSPLTEINDNHFRWNNVNNNNIYRSQPAKKTKRFKIKLRPLHSTPQPTPWYTY